MSGIRAPEPLPPTGTRCGGCQRWLSHDHSCYYDPRTRVYLCVSCVGDLVEERLGLRYVPRFQGVRA